MSERRVVDLFAGPGGWDLGARSLGIEPIGIELDESACKTRAAAGLWTIRADVASVPLNGFAGIDGLIASPPCQAFSTMGAGQGSKNLEALIEHVRRCATGWVKWDGNPDPDVWLVLEPLEQGYGL